MKKTLFMLLALMFISTVCFAQPPAAPVAPVQAPITPPAQMPPKMVEIKTATGAVDFVSAGDPAKNTKPEIVITDETGNKTSFAIKTTATIYDAAGKSIGFDSITKGEKVRIRYTSTKENVNEAVMVMIVND